VAQAYEYQVVANTNSATLVSSLATEDAAGWKVIGYSATYNGSGGGSPITWSAMLRRRV
jgi:hypothetical protein